MQRVKTAGPGSILGQAHIPHEEGVMTDRALVMRLRLLARLDVDAAAAYQAAIERVEEQPIKERLNAYRLDHTRHVQDLNEHITRLGGEPVDLTPDIAGLVLRGFTSLSGVLGTRGALAAMLANEQLTNATYEVMRRMRWPAEIQELIEANRADERRHFQWMLQAVRTPERYAGRDAEHPS
jgi:rubrerythrin